MGSRISSTLAEMYQQNLEEKYINIAWNTKTAYSTEDTYMIY